MIVEFTKFIEAISQATDYVEGELLSVPMFHEKRIAVLVNKMGRRMGMDEETVYALTIAGAMHDCALPEYLQDEITEDGYKTTEFNMASHCISGERIMLHYPFYERVKGAVLCHHDRADGLGATGRKAEDTPVSAQMIHIVDLLENQFGLFTMDEDKYRSMLAWMEGQCGTLFTRDMCRLFRETADYETLLSITGSRVSGLLNEILPERPVDIPIPVLRELADSFARVTDFKSHFTWRHSLGIAEKAEKLGRYYGFSEEKCQKLYIAGALHDIGKLLISNDILEKPGKLSDDEYRQIQNHAMGTWELLHDIGGMEEIARWAALHHEKLDGSGYPFGYTAADLGGEERMMACLDIYQALVEERPYKAGFPHEKAMDILRKMGRAGQLDREIIESLDRCFGDREGGKTAESAQVPEEQAFEGETWRCPVCGYTVTGEMPEHFICPRCEQPGTIFERVN